jgi:IclR family mhp operon transcriptional activator
MQVRVSTDHQNPLAVDKLLPGREIPMLQCAAGLAWISSLPTEERHALVERALRDPCERPDQVQWDPAALEEIVNRTRSLGYAQFRKPGRHSNLIGLSLPVFVHGNPVAALSVRFAESALPLRAGVERFLPPLRTIASQLGVTATARG